MDIIIYNFYLQFSFKNGFYMFVYINNTAVMNDEMIHFYFFFQMCQLDSRVSTHTNEIIFYFKYKNYY